MNEMKRKNILINNMVFFLEVALMHNFVAYGLLLRLVFDHFALYK